MGFWDNAERVVKLVAIVGGAAGVIGVGGQLYELNSKEEQRKIEGWQLAAVYKIVDDNKSVGFDDIGNKYVIEAQKLPSEIPRSKLTDQELQLVLLRLIQGQSVVESGPKIYSVKTYVGPRQVTAIQAEWRNLYAKHVSIMREALSGMDKPLTVARFQDKILSLGGNVGFLTENYPSLLEQIQFMGLAKIANDLVDAVPAGRPPLPMPDMPSEVSNVIGKLDDETYTYILNADPDYQLQVCLGTGDPGAMSSNSAMMKAKALDLVTLTDLNTKMFNGKPCSRIVEVELSTVGSALKSYLSNYLKNAILNKISRDAH